MTPAVALGRTVAMLRTAHGIKRRGLAEAAGVSYPYLSEIETGSKEPSLEVLRKIACSLGVAPSNLLARAEELAEGRITPPSWAPPRWPQNITHTVIQLKEEQ